MMNLGLHQYYEKLEYQEKLKNSDEAEVDF